MDKIKSEPVSGHGSTIEANNTRGVFEKRFHIFGSCSRDKPFYLSDEFIF